MSEENKTKKVKKILGIKGMNDILPEDALVWELLENTVRIRLKSYGYERIRTPIVEETGLFAQRPWRRYRYRRKGNVFLRGFIEWRPADLEA